jgi:hypothetical protein
MYNPACNPSEFELVVYSARSDKYLSNSLTSLVLSEACMIDYIVDISTVYTISHHVLFIGSKT